MSKNKKKFNCLECHYETMQWLGKCPQCNEWNTLEEICSDNESSTLHRNKLKSVTSLHEVKTEVFKRDITGIKEFDRVMGGGIVPGAVTLIGGEPGVGKSTLLLEVINKYANIKVDKKVLYVSGEESTSQVGARAKRLGINNRNILLLNEGMIQNIFDVVKSLRPTLVIIDSIQTTFSCDSSGIPGSVSQIREVTHEIIKEFKSNNVTSIIVGHITKEGGLAGPKLLEHMVDTVVYFEGDKTGEYRLLRTNKNRFGNTNEVGIFKMTKRGLVGVDNPQNCFINNIEDECSGRSITCVSEGTRSIFMEIQALVVENKSGNCKRSTVGIEQNRVLMLIGVVEKYLNISLGYHDIYINVAGGLKSSTTSSDLSIIASILSSYKLIPISNKDVFIGEVGLCGEVRLAPMLENKVKEIIQMNYKNIYMARHKKNENNFHTNAIGLKDTNTILDLYEQLFV